MNKQLLYIIIGAVMGFIPTLITLTLFQRWDWGDWVIFSLLVGAVCAISGSIGGWTVGFFVGEKWGKAGAVLGGLLCSIFGIIVAGMGQ